MVKQALGNNDKWDIRPNPNGNGLNICVIDEKKGLFYCGLNFLWKCARIPLYLFLRRKA